MTYADNKYILSSGEEFYVNNGLLSLSNDGCLYGGYDSEILDFLTVADKKEIAEYMIQQWQTYLASLNLEGLNERRKKDRY
jgi:hypothetical protein